MRVLREVVLFRSGLLETINWLLLALGDAVQGALGFVGLFIDAIDETVNPVLAPLLTWINVVINPVAGLALALIGVLPGWLSNTIVSAVSGVVLLILFKYTSNQTAIGRVKDDIKANLLALKLFKDTLSVTFRSQGRVFLGAFKLLRYAAWPLMVMMMPVTMELGQMGLWYQWRPLHVGEESLVTLTLGGNPNDEMPAVTVASISGADVTLGPVRIVSQREVVWRIQASESGSHVIVFEVDGQKIEKELVVGDGYRRASAVRPPREWTEILLHPTEAPFAKDSIVQSIRIDYPNRSSWTSGTDWWLAYFFVASLVFAYAAKPFLNVKI